MDFFGIIHKEIEALTNDVNDDLFGQKQLLLRLYDPTNNYYSKKDVENIVMRLL